MSHHASGPNFGFPRGDARLDLTDLYAFPKPADPGKSILVFNVHPSVGVNPPGDEVWNENELSSTLGNGASFKVNNPQAKASCGCGTSFSL